jgi:hypothetical protein
MPQSENNKIDPETDALLAEQRLIKDVVNHEGWKYVEQRFFDKLLSLQNVFDINDLNKTTIRNDILSRKKAHEILLSFWQDIKGTAIEADENRTLTPKHKYIYKKD